MAKKDDNRNDNRPRSRVARVTEAKGGVYRRTKTGGSKSTISKRTKKD